MSYKASIQFIRLHPFNKGREWRAVLNFLLWQFKTRFSKGPFAHRFTQRSKLLVRKGMRGATGNIYCGLHEFEDMSFLLHYLRAGDLFVDVGANVGTYTVLAAAHIGAFTIAVEPVPGSFHWLQRNIAFNTATDKTELFNGALAEQPGELAFTNQLGAMNHVARQSDRDTITVPVTSLDSLLAGRVPKMIKIDVEGYETPVMAGAAKTLQEPDLQVVIMELNNAGLIFGFNDDHLHQQMLQAGFLPYTYAPYQRRLLPLSKQGPHNTIYLRNPEDAIRRVQSAEPFTVQGRTL